LGSAELTGRDVVQAVYPELTPKEGVSVDTKRAVIGLEPGQSFERAACCQPLPGERIVGITFKGKGVVVHAIDCDRLIAYDKQPERWIASGSLCRNVASDHRQRCRRFGSCLHLDWAG
jgi:GTP pyrophosphokinase/guanosine-3',5'-bis(diphosphate) 3'-pyrophosphohydrolase